jgi:hypothetical protein
VAIFWEPGAPKWLPGGVPENDEKTGGKKKLPGAPRAFGPRILVSLKNNQQPGPWSPGTGPEGREPRGPRTEPGPGIQDTSIIEETRRRHCSRSRAEARWRIWIAMENMREERQAVFAAIRSPEPRRWPTAAGTCRASSGASTLQDFLA